jgi:hypothetical protein
MQASAPEQFNEEFTDDEAIARAFKFADLSSYPFKKRLLIRVADLAFYSIIRLMPDSFRDFARARRGDRARVVAKPPSARWSG